MRLAYGDSEAGEWTVTWVFSWSQRTAVPLTQTKKHVAGSHREGMRQGVLFGTSYVRGETV